MRTRRKIAICLILLYLITWIGGYYSYSANLKHSTQEIYDRAKQRDDEFAAAVAKEGGQPSRSRVFKDGPQSEIHWCFPILPGILIADSHWIVGPLFGRGGIKIVVYYGFGSWASKPFGGWIS
jgi:hypothetical protein